MQKKWNHKLLFSFFILFIFGAVVVLRAGILMLKTAPQLDAKLEKQFNQIPIKKIRRGKILDRNGNVLAISLPVKSLFANPKRLYNKRLLANRLSKILRVPEQSIYTNLSSKKRFVWLKRKLKFSEEKLIQKLMKNNESWQKGLGLVNDTRRFYPNQNLAAHLIGFTGLDDNGLEGIEYQYNDLLNKAQKSEIEGDALVLTVDSLLQAEVERLLKDTVEKSQAVSGSAIVLDALSGEIWAMASFPNYNLNFFQKSKPTERRNRAITDLFEPGSTIKSFTVAAGIDNKLLTLSKKIYCEAGKYKIGKYWIKESDPKHQWHWLKPDEILKHSSNIGAAKIGFLIGKNSLYKFFTKQGFNKETGIDLPGEVSSRLRPKEKLSKIGFSNVTFGQGMSVTAIKVAQAYAALANGGLMIKPQIIKRVETFTKEKISTNKTEVVSRTLKPATAEKVSIMLQKVVETDGSGFRANINGLEVAGKTGTAQKADPGVGYASGKYVASFAGYVRKASPRFVVFTMINEPKPPYHFGGVIAAPLFKKIMEYALARTGVIPQINQLGNINSNEIDKGIVSLPTVEKKMPNLKGLSARDVIKLFPYHKVNVRGFGSVTSQLPSVNSPLNTNTKIIVQLTDGRIKQ